MTLAEVGRGQTVGDILADLEDPKRDEQAETYWATVRRNLRAHKQGGNDRLADRRITRTALRAAQSWDGKRSD